MAAHPPILSALGKKGKMSRKATELSEFPSVIRVATTIDVIAGTATQVSNVAVPLPPLTNFAAGLKQNEALAWEILGLDYVLDDLEGDAGFFFAASFSVPGDALTLGIATAQTDRFTEIIASTPTVDDMSPFVIHSHGWTMTGPQSGGATNNDMHMIQDKHVDLSYMGRGLLVTSPFLNFYAEYKDASVGGLEVGKIHAGVRVYYRLAKIPLQAYLTLSAGFAGVQ